MIRHTSIVEQVPKYTDVEHLECDRCRTEIKGSTFGSSTALFVQGKPVDAYVLTLQDREGWFGFFKYHGEGAVSAVEKHLCPACVTEVFKP